MKPVYVINGSLESGKTEFICYTLAQPYFQIKGRTLLIVCEEGEVEYDEKLLARSRTDMVVIDEEEDFNTSHLIELEKKYRPERIIIEYNGMWNFKNMKLPWHWTVEQQITTVDASTFPMYFTNMKSLLAEMIRKSEMIIFNRCDGVEDLSVYIIYHWYEPNQARDKSNICSFGMKVIEDALVRFHIIDNDGWKNVVGFEHEFQVDPKRPRVEVELMVID